MITKGIQGFFLPTSALDGREEEWLSRLSSYRRARIQTSLLGRSRTLGLAAGVALDLALRGYGLRERDMTYAFGPEGKPYFADGCGLYFNLSHTEGAVLLVLGEEELGCDIEYVRPVRFHIAERYFSPQERAYISERGEDAFFRIWTAKESYLKAIGSGIRKLSSVTVDPENGLVLGDGQWRLHEYTVQGYAASCCARGSLFAPLCDLSLQARCISSPLRNGE